MERREEWTYIETKHAAKIDCGEFELRPGWNGILDASELRRLLQRAVTEHNQHATLIEQRDLLVAALRETVPHLDCNCYRAHGRDCVKGKVEHALATVEQGGEA